jgi:uncharacterized protein YycO
MVKLHFWNGTGLSASVVRWWTRGPYSHAAIEIRGNCYDSMVLHGVRTWPMGQWPKQLGEPVVTFEIKHELFDLNSSNQDLIEKWLLSKVGAPYDYFGILNFLFKGSELAWSRNRFFCSEFILEALQVGACHLVPRCDPYKINPNILSYSLGLRSELE